MSITQNAFKGYSFQDTVYCMFALLLDTDKNMFSIDAEFKKKDKNKTHNFDDMKVVYSNIEYYIQIKNYKNLTQNDIKIENGVVVLGATRSILRDGKNVIILHGCELQNNDSLFGIPSYLLNEVHIISINAPFICEHFSRIYKDDISRFSNIAFKFAKDRLSCAEFYATKNDLPPVNLFPQKLTEDTACLRETFQEAKFGILYIIGKPGIGKSHYVEELAKTIPNNIVYRFWIDSQDKYKQQRLDYRNFIREIKYSVFNRFHYCTEDDIIAEITKNNVTLLIDGLDHVENYNPCQLDLYLKFLSKLDNVKCIVFTRPLKVELIGAKYDIENWNYEQTCQYLEICHKISEIKVWNDIFQVSNGYPIIANFFGLPLQAP